MRFRNGPDYSSAAESNRRHLQATNTTFLQQHLDTVALFEQALEVLSRGNRSSAKGVSEGRSFA